MIYKKFLLSLLLLTFFSKAQYNYEVDLVNVKDDKVSVKLFPPAVTEQTLEFSFPAMVPGTYEVYDFGRFISNFKVTGKKGAAITVVKTDINTYKISPANQIETIEYLVDDTFDKCKLPKANDKIIFEPAGTNIEAGKNFAINTHCMFGYFRGKLNQAFVVSFIKPAGFYPSTGLSSVTTGKEKDIIKAESYHDLADAPILYFVPDTTIINVGTTKVLVSCYSPNKLINSDFIARTLQNLLTAQKEYLGGELPVSKYAFLFFFTDKPTLSNSNGALEHSYSSFYVLPEYDSLSLEQTIRDVTAHEFFHIITPLNIHAKEIGEFDFNNPQMSEHLWLYEGMTEYSAHHAQLKGGITNLDYFLTTMLQKYQTSLEHFNDTMSFTKMSKRVLEKKIHPEYNNVYEKGAVIGMCLDILLREKSNGKYGTQNLMKDLASKYGKSKSFDDKDLFNDIEKFTYPEVGEFLRNYVGGPKPLPLTEIFAKVGIDFMREKNIQEFSLGNPDLNFNTKTERLYVTNIKEIDEFGKELGYKNKDELAKINGVELTVKKLREIIANYYEKVREGDKVEIEVYRKKFLSKKYKPILLSAKARKINVMKKYQIALMKEPTETQRLILKKWISNS